MARPGRPRIRLQIPEWLLARYAAGDADHHEVARVCGVCPRVALRELRDAGMDTSRSARKRLRRARECGLSDPYSSIRLLYNLGLSLREVGQQFGMTREGVRQVLMRDHVHRRPPGVAAAWPHPEPDEAARAFAGRLRAARLAARLNQGELAARCGLSRQTISSLERGAQRPTRETLARLVDVLGADELAGLSGPPVGAEAS
jgi:DNA-binding XRE family transcriptional regulator